jgi:hypothetical protein
MAPDALPQGFGLAEAASASAFIPSATREVLVIPGLMPAL